MNVGPAVEADFNDWYNAEHLPQLGAVPGVLTARRFRATDPASERRYLALYHLKDAERDPLGCVGPRREHAMDRADAAAFPRHAGAAPEPLSAEGLNRMLHLTRRRTLR